MVINITIRKIDPDDYEDDEFENYYITNSIDDIRYCDCGRRMYKNIRHEEIYGQWVCIEEWKCDVCD